MALKEHSGVKFKKTLLGRFLKQWDKQAMVLPGIIFLIIFSYIPMYGLVMAFQQYDIFKGFWKSKWVGFSQFNAFFDTPEFWQIMRNTLCISFLKLLFVFTSSIVLAIMFNELKNEKFKRVMQTITYLPNFISWVTVSGFAIALLATDNGSLNQLLISINVIQDPINWLSIPRYFWGILIATNTWKSIGFGSIIYLAAMSGINPELYEAARMDGASRWQQIKVITLPGILPVINIYLILTVGNILNAGFDDILALTNYGNNSILNNVAEVIDTYTYKSGIQHMRYSYATAAGVFKSGINVIVLVVVNKVSKKLGGESLW